MKAEVVDKMSKFEVTIESDMFDVEHCLRGGGGGGGGGPSHALIFLKVVRSNGDKWSKMTQNDTVQVLH